MDFILETKILLERCSESYVGLWEVRQILFYQQADREVSPDFEMRQKAFNESEKVRQREIILVGALVVTFLRNKWVELVACLEPDGEMTVAKFAREYFGLA